MAAQAGARVDRRTGTEPFRSRPDTLPPGMMRRLALVLLLLATPAAGQSRPAPRTFTQEDLKKAEIARDAASPTCRNLEAASASASRALAAMHRHAAAAADTTAREEAAYAAEEQLMLLADESQTATATLASDQAAMEDLLAALMAFGARRPPALATSPDDVSGAVRAAILMSDAAPALKARAEDLRKRLAAIDIAEATRARQAPIGFGDGRSGRPPRGDLGAGRGKTPCAGKPRRGNNAARAQAQRPFASEADDLRGLLDALAKTVPPKPSLKPFPNQRPSQSPSQRQGPP